MKFIWFCCAGIKLRAYNIKWAKTGKNEPRNNHESTAKEDDRMREKAHLGAISQASEVSDGQVTVYKTHAHSDLLMRSTEPVNILWHIKTWHHWGMNSHGHADKPGPPGLALTSASLGSSEECDKNTGSWVLTQTKSEPRGGLEFCLSPNCPGLCYAPVHLGTLTWLAALRKKTETKQRGLSFRPSQYMCKTYNHIP